MIGITERIKAILTEYAEKYNSAALERDRLKADNSAKYLPQVASVENEKVDEAFKESIAPIKEKAFKDVVIKYNIDFTDAMLRRGNYSANCTEQGVS